MYTTSGNTIVSRSGTGATLLRNRVGEAIPMDVIQRFAPTVFADDKHTSRSERFTYVPTHAILHRMIDEGFLPVEVRTGGSRDREKLTFTKHAITFRKPGTVTARQVGDLHREVRIGNAHDGTAAYSALSAIFRLACLNGMLVQEGEGDMIRIPHKGDIAREVIDAAYTIVDNGNRVDRSIAEMKAVQLAPAQQEAFAEAAMTLRWDEGTAPIQPRALLTARRPADQGNDLWRTFNRVQENLIERAGLPYRHVGTRSDGRRFTQNRRTGAVQGIDDNARLNRALWVLAARLRDAA